MENCTQPKLKVCRDCQLPKSVTDFYKHSEGRAGCRPECKACTLVYKKRWSAEHPGAVEERRKIWISQHPEQAKRIRKKSYEKRKHTLKYAFVRYQVRCKVDNISFQLAFDEFAQFWQKPCVYCGNAIDKIGLDRVDNNLGYTVSNVVPCCKQCNQMKMDYTRSEFIEHCMQIIKHTDRMQIC